MEKGCPNCGRMIDVDSEKCPYCKYDFGKINQMFVKYEQEREIKVPKYAGFIKRMAATGFDNFLLTVIFLIVNVIYIYLCVPEYHSYLYMLQETPITSDFSIVIKLLLPWVFYPFVYFFYCVFRQGSKKMGTVGEKLVGIEVVDDEDSPINYGKAFTRNLARLLNIITLGIGALIIAFTKKKQALSDIVTHTCVANRVTSENYNEYSYAGAFVRLLAYIIDMAVIYLLYWVATNGVSLFMTFMTDNLEMGQIASMSSTITLILTIIISLMILLYFPYMESRKGGTIGKLILKIKVVKLDGENIGFFKSIIRLFCMTIESYVPFGLLLVFVTPRRQTLKDLMTKTIVINKN